jgi:acetyl-CoA carboxylase biotin carboxyl carrier protein
MARVVVKSEVAGNMWKIETTVGAVVAEEDQLMILESMKMEIPIVATAAGKVTEILVAEGDPVAEEQPVLVIET